MAATKTPEQILQENAAKQAAAMPPHVVAKFAGDYYKSAGLNMNERGRYEVEVRVPMQWIEEEIGLNAQGVFINFLAPRVLANKPEFPAYNGIATCYLVECSELPNNMNDSQFLTWTADRKTLLRFIQNRRLPVESDLYATVDELRFAIRRCLKCMSEQGSDVKIFLKEQEKRKTGRKAKFRSMEQELAALGY